MSEPRPREAFYRRFLAREDYHHRVGGLPLEVVESSPDITDLAKYLADWSCKSDEGTARALLELSAKLRKLSEAVKTGECTEFEKEIKAGP